MKNFPSVFNFPVIVNELKIYTSFIEEKTNINFYTGNVVNRVWFYRWSENSFLANRTVFNYSQYDATLYDYSELLKVEVDMNNYKNFENSFNIVAHDLTKERLTITQIKTILANNAKAAIRAEFIMKQIEKFKTLAEDF